jgi:crotonobetainyl-CoA:carnitine CoA-transferase CaiB-like acyl-CoA transferase
MDSTLNKRSQKPVGNHSNYSAPHDVYACIGYDAWCAISVQNEKQWDNLKTIMGSPNWADQTEYSSIDNRVTNKTTLDEHLNEWTSQFTATTAARILQKGGVPASAVMTAEDLYHDVHLRARSEGIVQINHPEFGITEHQGLNIHLSETPGTSTIPAPAKGEHNEYVFEKVLGLTKKTIAGLKKKGALS